MKRNISSLPRLAIVTLAAFPAFALAAPPTTSPYNTDVTNSYVQDQTSQVMVELNNILCFMGAMAPDQMVNLATNSGNYIALVDKNTCGGGGGGGGKSTSTGPAYAPAIVHSARASSTADMLVKVWVSPEQGNDITVYATATTAPSATLPYGVFRMDFCGGANCSMDKGFINATSSGLAFYTDSSGMGGGTTALQLNATSTTAASGAVNSVNPWSGNSSFTFAYNSSYFVRNDGTTSKCFDRSPLNADESVWRYGLYDATTGAQITRNSGFPIEYTDASNVTTNGYVGYHGLWAQGTGPASGSTVQQVTYSASGATKTPYTLLKTGGKLRKYTTVQKTLADLHKVTFWYFAQANIPAAGTPVMNAASQYLLYWDDTAKQFFVSGKQNTTSFNMESYPTPVAVANADMLTANQWGLFGWSQMMGGQFGIKGTDFASLTTTPSTIPVRAQMEDVVYPSQFAAITGGLTCINDCPTAALITTSNSTGSSPFSNAGWAPVTTFVNYTLNGTTGNMVDAAGADVLSTATTGTNANGVKSGRLITPTVKQAMITAKEASGVCGSTAVGACSIMGYNQGDVDFLPIGSSYYEWETGSQPWNQLAILKDAAGVPVTFDPPLAVNFVVPAGAKYGNYAGATLRLEYGGFGELWGIPNECIDVATNTACTFGPGGTSQQNQRWASLFSIPFDAVTGIVSVAVAQGTTTAGTQYLAKPLDKEIRLANAPLSTCTAASLTAPAANTITLPVAASFIDPTTSAGTKPTFATAPAPQVIHGVKQY